MHTSTYEHTGQYHSFSHAGADALEQGSAPPPPPDTPAEATHNLRVNIIRGASNVADSQNTRTYGIRALSILDLCIWFVCIWFVYMLCMHMVCMCVCVVQWLCVWLCVCTYRAMGVGGDGRAGGMYMCEHRAICSAPSVRVCSVQYECKYA